MSKSIDIWLVGNTGLRNPRRIAEGFALYAASPFVGKLYGHENEFKFMRFLHENGIINNEPGRDQSASHARKWRLMFEKSGFIYRKLKRSEGNQEEYGQVGAITPFGYSFLQADTYAAQQDCFLRAFSVEQIPTTDKTALFSPLRWILAVMLELEQKTGTSEISRTEFALWGQTTDPTYELDEVVYNILDLRKRRKAASSKRVFDRNEKTVRAELYPKKVDNFFDYCDMNMRYLRITGVVQRRGRGLIIAPAKHAIAEELAKDTVGVESAFEAYQALANGAPLPSDNNNIARQLLKSIEQMAKKQNVYYDISDLNLDDTVSINIARLRIEEALQLTSEIQYAERQRYEWLEIVEYMKIIEKGGGSSNEEDEDVRIEVPKDETPAYLEWILWRAVLAIDHLINKPYEVRGFKIDSDFLPVSTAGGGRSDLYCDFSDFMLLTEVSMSTSSRQEAMEGEPVRRHVSDAIDQYQKPVYGLFIAVKIDTNTAETFRHGTWYDQNDNKRRLNILPLTLRQFREYFTAMFVNQKTSPVYLRELISACSARRDILTGPAWKEFIQETVFNTVSQFEYAMVKFPRLQEKVAIHPGATVLHAQFGYGYVLTARIKFKTSTEKPYELPFIAELPDSVTFLLNGDEIKHETKGQGIVLGYQIAFGDQVIYFSKEDANEQLEVLA